MRAMFEKISNDLAEMLKSKKGYATGGIVQGVDNSDAGADVGNSVGNFFNGVYSDPASTQDNSTLGPSNQDISDTPVKQDSTVNKIAKSVGKSFSSSNGANPDHLWGYSSPVMIAERYLQAGKFYNPNYRNEYLNTFEKPPKPQTIQAQTTSDFYNKWYSMMRQFSQAEEVAGNGKVTTRSR